jgi:hypothetical protein
VRRADSYRRGPSGPWYGNDRDRAVFERMARKSFATLSARTGAEGRLYTVTVDVPHYEPRRVEIMFAPWARNVPRVTADGPKESPHRYPAGELCMWYPDDPPDARWIWEDGLLRLLIHTQLHLFREAYWRENDFWPGPQFDHGPKEIREGE